MFKSNSLYWIRGADPESSVLIEKIGDITCPAPQSIAPSPIGIFWAARDGVILTDGSQIKKVSRQIDGYWKDLVHIPEDWIGEGFYFNSKYYLLLTTIGGNTSVLIYDNTHGGWYRWEYGTYHLTCLGMALDNDGRYELWAGTQEGKLLSLGDNYGADPPTWTLKTVPLTLNDPHALKMIRKIDLDVITSEAVDITLTVTSDFGGKSWSKVLSGITTGMHHIGIAPLEGRSFQVEIGGQGSITINSITIHAWKRHLGV